LVLTQEESREAHKPFASVQLWDLAHGRRRVFLTTVGSPAESLRLGFALQGLAFDCDAAAVSFDRMEAVEGSRLMARDFVIPEHSYFLRGSPEHCSMALASLLETKPTEMSLSSHVTSYETILKELSRIRRKPE
jgi:hypothetical protein